MQKWSDEILKRFRRDPQRDDFEELWRAAGSEQVIDLLAKDADGASAGASDTRHRPTIGFSISLSSVPGHHSDEIGGTKI